MPALAIVLLVVALLLFLFSTRQMALMWRSFAWAGGLIALLGAGWMSLSGGRANLFVLIGDFFANIGSPGDSILVRTLGGNWPSVVGAIGPMFDIFLVIAGVIAIVALLAFTPGEGVERAERPVNIALIGALGGGFLALAIAGVGFGGVAKRKVYLNTPTAEDVIDGDTIRMGDISLRLWGVDAPEEGQLCRGPQGEPYECAPVARDYLVSLIEGRLLICGPPVGKGGVDLPPAQMPALQETFGRPIVMCHVNKDGKRINVAQTMATDGYVHVFEDAMGVKSDYGKEIIEAALAKKGLHDQEFLPPWLWRNDPAERCSFLERIGFDKLSDRAQKQCIGFVWPPEETTPVAPAPSPN